jgi:hypothetical protein
VLLLYAATYSMRKSWIDNACRSVAAATMTQPQTANAACSPLAMTSRRRHQTPTSDVTMA